MRLALVDYQYLGVKAKNLAYFRVPFTKWHSTKSLLTVTLKGVQPINGGAEKKPDVSTTFEVEWDREKAFDEKYGAQLDAWKQQDACKTELAVSPAFEIWDMKNVDISVTVKETSRFKEALDELANAVKKIKVE